MPAFNFHDQFVDAILDGEKTQTIRKERTYPILKGQTLHLYTAQRTIHCRKLMEVKCTNVHRITISAWNVHIELATDPSRGIYTTTDELNKFAKKDGFKDWQSMREYWLKGKGLPFTGIIIYWKKPRKK